MDGRFVAYYRVSTDKQDTDCAAQRIAVEAYLNGGGWQLLGEEKDVETGKHSDRPGLQKAIALCKRKKATLVIAKLDRLARNVHFVSGLLESKVNFLCVDNPHANKMTIQMMAVFAEHERDMIAKRTSERLQALKAQGTPWVSKKSGRLVERLGSPNPQAGAVAGGQAVTAAADQFAAKMLPTIEAIRARGITTLAGIADELTRQKWPTARGGETWTPMAVSNLIKRTEAQA